MIRPVGAGGFYYQVVHLATRIQDCRGVTAWVPRFGWGRGAHGVTILNAWQLRFRELEAGDEGLCVMCKADAVHAVS